MTTNVQTFYRYLRPVAFDKNRHSPIAKSTGGVSFLVTNYAQLANGTYTVDLVIAVCPMDQKYDKNVAKRILDVRHEAGHAFTIQSMGLDAESLGRGVITTSDLNRLEVAEEDIYKNYLRFAIAEYADAIEYILRSHRSAEFLGKMSSDTVAALGIGDMYKEESK